MTKTLSCKYIHNYVYLAPDQLRHCCKRFYVNGEMKGDVKIFDIKNDDDVSVDKIIKEKKKLYDDINLRKKTECSGCPYLYKDEWPEIENLKIKHMSIENHSVCNMKCTYCSEIYYGGKKSNYDLKSILSKLENSGVLSKDIRIVWGGGEPVLSKDFNQSFDFIINKLNPSSVMVYTNSTVFNETLEKYLKDKKIMITTSIDAGNVETFKKVRGVKVFEKVFQNLKTYADACEGKNIIIKYIFTNDNSSYEEIDGFLDMVKKYKLFNCQFQISYDFTSENISKDQLLSTSKLYFDLKKNNVQDVFFDYHLKPRIQKSLREFIRTNDKDLKSLLNNYKLINKNKTDVIVWGAGDSGRSLLKEKYLMNFFNYEIKYFVDKKKDFLSKNIDSFSIKSPETITENDYKVLIASSAFYGEIRNEFLKLDNNPKRLIENLFL